ncbi:uncharacterized protein LOC123009825 [Tribolium madens]|uniref:uncharacterized protein LOC123009825 n=1 Tax=Tribolium madens TaxID=41895 RepID=UPI001CF72979|nr:uncharacterized protein LOC123009825 [Tribolium madens]
MDFSEKRPFKDDPLWIIRLLTVDTLSKNISKFLMALVLTFLVILSISAMLFGGDIVTRILSKFDRWAVDSLENRILPEIKTESFYCNIFVIINLILTLIPVILFIIPVEHDDDVFFAFFYFKRQFPNYSTILSGFYRATFPILGYVMVTCVHEMVYVVEQIKFQAYLIIKVFEKVTDVFNDLDESFLLRNRFYQNEVSRRFKFCIKRHVELLSIGRTSLKFVEQLIPVFAINGILFFVSTIIFCFTTDVLTIANTYIRWCSLSRENLQYAGIMSIIAKKQFAVRFSDNIIINYELGFKVLKMVYSLLCFLIQYDPLWIVRLLAVDILNKPFTRFLMTIVLLFHIAVLLIQIYFICFIQTFDDFIKYSAVFFAMFYINLSLITLLYEGNIVTRILKKCNRWALNTIDDKIYQEIRKEAIFCTCFVITNLILTLVAIFTFLTPVELDKDVFFPVYFFNKFLDKTCATILIWIYRATFLLLGLVVVTCAHQLLYVIQQFKFQVYLLQKYVENITNIEFFDEIDSILLKNVSYQKEVKRRIQFCVKRHIQILTAANQGMDFLKKWIPIYSITGILFLVSIVFSCVAFNGSLESVYFRVSAISVVSVTTFCAIIFVGESTATQSDVLSQINTYIRWCSLNRENLQFFAIISIITKEPYYIRFSDNLVINYELGIKVVKLVYTLLCFLIQCKGVLY